ncbi:MAG: hypothetical protein K0Q48_2437 [Bacillota bacterium]|jgi:hypothetical protein|nr:hypothetical protein [Bacillota bacterium]
MPCSDYSLAMIAAFSGIQSCCGLVIGAYLSLEKGESNEL